MTAFSEVSMKKCFLVADRGVERVHGAFMEGCLSYDRIKMLSAGSDQLSEVRGPETVSK